LDRFPDLFSTMVEWTKSPHVWVRRAAAVSLVKFARRGKHLDIAYRIARRLLADKEDLIHKAVGWLLREAGRTDSDRLVGFLCQHGPKIPRTTLRYAIERFPNQQRKRLLVITKGDPRRLKGRSR
jgi:3-methyladenine DNA glycosylase AlkD